MCDKECELTQVSKQAYQKTKSNNANLIQLSLTNWTGLWAKPATPTNLSGFRSRNHSSATAVELLTGQLQWGDMLSGSKSAQHSEKATVPFH